MNFPASVPATPRPPYASWIPGRAAGSFKTHTTIGNLKNALHVRVRHNREINRSVFDATIGVYTLRGNDYVLWLTLEEGTSPSDYPLLFK